MFILLVCLFLFIYCKTIKHYEILSRLCPTLNTSARGELKSKKLPDLNHVVVVKNGLISDESTKYPGTWSFKEDLAKFNQNFKPTPKINFDDTITLLFTVGDFLIIFNLYRLNLSFLY